MKIRFSKRHLAKTLTWRFIATSDTVIIAFLISGDLSSGLKIGGIELLTKMILYYLHERIWFKTKFQNSRFRHLIKSFTWRFIGTIDTVIISGVVLGNSKKLEKEDPLLKENPNRWVMFPIKYPQIWEMYN